MVRYLILLFLLTGLCQISFAQKYDVGINLGGTVYMGELNPRQFYNFNRGGGGIIVRRNLNPDFAIKLALNELLVHGDDMGTGNRDRNLFFTSYVTEASLQFEFNFFKFNPFDRRESYSPYVFAGLGVFHFNPYTILYGKKTFLRGVGTEVNQPNPFQTPTLSPAGATPSPAGTMPSPSGTTPSPAGTMTPPSGAMPPPGAPELDITPVVISSRPASYARTSFCLPIGVGYKFHLVGHLSMNIEYGIRLTFTDYLDDVSGRYPTYNVATKVGEHIVPLSNRGTYDYKAGDQRGDSWKYDKYLYGSVGIVYTFRSIDCPKFK